MGALAVVAALALIQILLMKFGRDQGIYAVVADAILRGEMPYRDAWDFKPPGVFLVYTLAQGIFGSNEWSIRLLEVISFGSLVPILGTLARRFFGDARIGWVGAVLAIWVQAQLEFWHTAQPESFGGVLALGALALSTHPVSLEGPGRKWKPWVRLFGAGLLFGFSGLMKPHLLGVPVVAALHTAWHMRTLGQPIKRQLQAFLSIAAGSTTTVAACLFWFAARGALGDLVHTLFVFAPGYAATTFDSRHLLHYFYTAINSSVMGYSAIIAAGILLSIGFDRRSPREREGLWLLAAAALPQVLGIALQSKFFAYHHGATFPFLALMAAPGLWKLWQASKKLRWIGPPLFGIGLVATADARSATVDLPETFLQRSQQRTLALWSTPEERARMDGRLYSVADVDYAANQQVADWLRTHTKAGDSIYLWGFEPHIYHASGRRPASKFIYNVPQRVAWENRWAKDWLMDELRRSPPAAIVVQHGDVFGRVTGNHKDSARALEEFPELRHFIGNGYEIRERIRDFDVYARR